MTHQITICTLKSVFVSGTALQIEAVFVKRSMY